MKTNIFRAILILLLPIFLFSCQTAKDALQGKQRSKSADEFLVEKKNPLTMPPDFNKLPTPGQTEDEIIGENLNEETNDVKALLNLGENQNIDTKNNPTLEGAEIETNILKKIK